MRYLCVLVLGLLLSGCGGGGGGKGGANLPAIDTHTADMRHIEGFVDLYWDDVTGRLFVEVAALDEPFIYVSSLSRGVGSNDLGLDRGQLGDTRLARFVRSGGKVLLLADNPAYVADSDNADERRAVEEAFARSAIGGFEVVAASGERVLVDGTDFFLRDAHGVARRLKDKEQGEYRADPERSAIFLPRTRGFPDNTEVDAMVTLAGDAQGDIIASVAPDPRAVTVHQHHSFIRLPEAGYEPLPYDPRSGFIDPGYDTLRYDYATAIGEPVKRTYAWRHRLRKKQPEAALSEPVEPIVYYLDRGAPEPVRSALMEGAAWWNQAFEAAGYKDAFQVKLLPEGADPMDVRYNVIQWVHRSTRGWSYGYSVRDPRTQEILKGHVTLGSLRVRQDYLLAEGLLAPYGEDGEVPPELLDFALARIRQLAAHEVGHTLGLEHNFAASSDGRASVMDYPHPYVTLGEDGEVDLSRAYDSGIGEWDKRAILYGYQDFAEGVDAAAARERIIRDTYSADGAGLHFVADAHSRGDAFAITAGPAHPRGSLWDNGADPVAELERLTRLRETVLARFSDSNIRLGRPLAEIENALVPMYLMHRYQVQAAATLIGGQEFSYALRGDGQIPTAMIAPGQQRRAVEALLATIAPQALALRPELVALIPPRPPGDGDGRELFPRQTGYVFDPLAAAATAAGLTLDMLLDPTRAARMNNNRARSAAQPGFPDLLDALLTATWYAPAESGQAGALRRVVNMEILERLQRLAGNGRAQPQARAEALDALLALRDWLGQQASSAVPKWRAHYRFAAAQIQRFVDDPQAMAGMEALKAPPGSPI
ncbi:zinc-dependent metalloprotease [Parahaliea mediterranea]|uniref:Zinc-dependent metalloprotease n=1 Tax=Parahaliea mediterranea TaxID=651086 RepID=A0A939DI57_9GAMM|nr:zinc-dependent metalloprotease [Parahaliea mediterranea]MBN7798709.1 zinc-dependent metalloprotease [Parahaliea mediterranea]